MCETIAGQCCRASPRSVAAPEGLAVARDNGPLPQPETGRFREGGPRWRTDADPESHSSGACCCWA